MTFATAFRTSVATAGSIFGFLVFFSCRALLLSGAFAFGALPVSPPPVPALLFTAVMVLSSPLLSTPRMTSHASLKVQLSRVSRSFAWNFVKTWSYTSVPRFGRPTPIFKRGNVLSAHPGHSSIMLRTPLCPPCPPLPFSFITQVGVSKSS